MCVCVCVCTMYIGGQSGGKETTYTKGLERSKNRKVENIPRESKKREFKRTVWGWGSQPCP